MELEPPKNRVHLDLEQAIRNPQNVVGCDELRDAVANRIANDEISSGGSVKNE